MPDFNASCTDEITCPYCGETFSNSWERSEGEHECGECGKRFEAYRNVSVTWSSFKPHEQAPR